MLLWGRWSPVLMLLLMTRYSRVLRRSWHSYHAIPSYSAQPTLSSALRHASWYSTQMSWRLAEPTSLKSPPFTNVCCCASTRPHYMSCLSVPLSSCPVQTFDSKRKRHRKPQIGLNVPQVRSNWCANFDLKRSKVRVRKICRHWAVMSFLVQLHVHTYKLAGPHTQHRGHHPN